MRVMASYSLGAHLLPGLGPLGAARGIVGLVLLVDPVVILAQLRRGGQLQGGQGEQGRQGALILPHPGPQTLDAALHQPVDPVPGHELGQAAQGALVLVIGGAEAGAVLGAEGVEVLAHGAFQILEVFPQHAGLEGEEAGLTQAFAALLHHRQSLGVMVVVPQEGGHFADPTGIPGIPHQQVLPSGLGGLGAAAILFQFAEIGPQGAGILQGGGGALHQEAGQGRVGARGQTAQGAVQGQHPLGQGAIAGIAGLEAIGGLEGLLETRQPRPALEEQQIIHRRAVAPLLQGLEVLLQGARAHGLAQVVLPHSGIQEEERPAAFLHELVGNHHGAAVRVLVVLGLEGGVPLAGGHQVASGVEDRGAVGEPLQGLEPHPVRPGDQADAPQDLGLFGDLHSDAAGALGAGEDLAGPEALGDGFGQSLEVAVVAALGVPAGEPGPDAGPLEAVQGPLVARPQLVIQVPALQAAAEVEPELLGVGEPIQLRQDQPQG